MAGARGGTCALGHKARVGTHAVRDLIRLGCMYANLDASLHCAGIVFLCYVSSHAHVAPARRIGSECVFGISQSDGSFSAEFTVFRFTFFHHLYPLTTLSGSFQQLRASMSLCLLDDGPDEITQFSLECSRSCQTFHLARPTHIHRVAWGLGAVLSTWTWVHGHGYMDIEMRSTCTCTCTCSLVGVHATLPQSPY